MPIIACPKCPTKLRIADGATGNAKCPKCATVFAIPSIAPPPAFEVVEDEPTPPPPPAPVRPRVVAPTSPSPSTKKGSGDTNQRKPQRAEAEAEDRPRNRPRRDEDDEERERDRDRRRREDEDDEDRPRNRRRREDEDDEDDDRPVRKSARRGRDEDDDDRPTGDKNAGVYRAAKTGSMLVGISLWIYLGTFGLLLLFLLLAWIGVAIPNGLMILAGLVGLTNWIMGLVGLGFCIAGPSKARGLAIAATAVAGVHLALTFVVANNTKAGYYGFHIIETLSAAAKAERIVDRLKKLQSETDPKRREALEKDLRAESDSGRGSGSDFRESSSRGSDMRWSDLTSLLPYSDQFIAVLAYRSKGFEYYILPLLAGLLEVARLILIILLIGSIARASKTHDVADKSGLAVIIASATMGASLLVVLIVAVIGENSGSKVNSLEEAQKAMKTAMTWMALSGIVIYLCHLGSLVLPALLAMGTSSGCSRKAR